MRILKLDENKALAIVSKEDDDFDAHNKDMVSHLVHFLISKGVLPTPNTDKINIIVGDMIGNEGVCIGIGVDMIETTDEDIFQSFQEALEDVIPTKIKKPEMVEKSDKAYKINNIDDVLFFTDLPIYSYQNEFYVISDDDYILEYNVSRCPKSFERILYEHGKLITFKEPA